MRPSATDGAQHSAYVSFNSKTVLVLDSYEVLTDTAVVRLREDGKNYSEKHWQGLEKFINIIFQEVFSGSSDKSFFSL